MSFPLQRRYERLEEQLNDLTELHQNEMTNLKQELASMEEKVAYQSYERARDIQVWEDISCLHWPSVCDLCINYIPHTLLPESSE